MFSGIGAMLLVVAREVSKSPKTLSTEGSSRFLSFGKPYERHPTKKSVLLSAINRSKPKNALNAKGRN